MRSLPSDLTAKVKQSLQTLGSAGDPKLLIAASRAKTTVSDANYWTVENIRTKVGLGDISLAPRRLRPKGKPDRLYEIHVENGQVHTALREYPDKQKQGWQPQFTLGSGSAVAIDFDGHWERYKKLWRLVTDEKPWITWVDGAGVLWVQLWDDETTKFQLATDVVKIEMLRGWKNPLIPENDQGIIVAYIKTDGKVYYRNYCVQVDLTSVWESPRVLDLFVGTAVNVSMFLTSDYRMGFTIQASDGKIHWLVAHRNWGGMASPAENISASVTNLAVSLAPVTYYHAGVKENISASILNLDIQLYPASFDISNVVVTSTKKLTPNRVKLVFSHDLLNVPGSESNFTFSGKTISSVSVGDTAKEILIDVLEPLPSFGVWTVTYNPGNIRVLVNDMCSPLLTSKSTVIQGEPPNNIERIQTNITNLSVTLTAINYQIGYSAPEKINTSITNLAVILTKVGSNPL